MQKEGTPPRDRCAKPHRCCKLAVNILMKTLVLVRRTHNTRAQTHACMYAHGCNKWVNRFLHNAVAATRSARYQRDRSLITRDALMQRRIYVARRTPVPEPPRPHTPSLFLALFLSPGDSLRQHPPGRPRRRVPTTAPLLITAALQV